MHQWIRLFSLLVMLAVASAAFGGAPEVTKSGPDTYRIGELEFSSQSREVRIPATLNMSEGLLEVLLCTPEGKVHESLFVTHVQPTHLQIALITLGLQPWYEPRMAKNEWDGRSLLPESVSRCHIMIEYPDGTRKPVEELFLDRTTGHIMPQTTWSFVGSQMDVNGQLMAEADQTLIASYHLPTVLENDLETRNNDEVYQVAAEIGLKKGDPVTIVIVTNPEGR